MKTTLLLLSLLSLSLAAENEFFAMDNGLRDVKPLAGKAALLNELGYDEKNFKAWAWTDNNGHLSSKAYLELAKRISKETGIPIGPGASNTTGNDWGPFVVPEEV